VMYLTRWTEEGFQQRMSGSLIPFHLVANTYQKVKSKMPDKVHLLRVQGARNSRLFVIA
jgi:hypothetical protein